MEKLKKRLSLLGARRDMLEGEAKLLLKENLIDTSPEEMSFNDRIKDNTLKKWCDTLPISSELQCSNGTTLEEAEQLVNKYVADRFMSIKNSCDTKVTGGICYDTSNNKGVCIRNDVRDFEKELEIYGNLSREKCQFTDPTTNTKKDMEFYYLTTVPSLDLSIKEKTPVQFKLNTPIPTPEPSVGKIFKFNNKKGIIGHQIISEKILNCHTYL